jgi:hypothetical protein
MKNSKAKEKWKTKEVPVDMVTHTEKNYKIKTELGKARLQTSLKMFGIAGNVIVNLPHKGKSTYPLIDGNSRLIELKEAGKKRVSISYPSRRLTEKEFKEMSAMFDFAKAGEVDDKEIEKDFGDSADFWDRWGKEMPLEMRERLETMGKKSKVDTNELAFPGKKGKQTAVEINDIQMVNLFFSTSQEEWFRKIEEKHAEKLKAESTTDFVLKSLKKLYK